MTNFISNTQELITQELITPDISDSNTLIYLTADDLLCNIGDICEQQIDIMNLHFQVRSDMYDAVEIFIERMCRDIPNIHAMLQKPHAYISHNDIAIIYYQSMCISIDTHKCRRVLTDSLVYGIIHTCTVDSCKFAYTHVAEIMKALIRAALHI
jgi:hypothetical protein